MGNGSDQNILDTHQMGKDEIEAIRASVEASQTSSISLLLYSPEGVTAVPLSEGRGVVVGRFAPADITLPLEACSCSGPTSRKRDFNDNRYRALWSRYRRSTNGSIRSPD